MKVVLLLFFSWFSFPVCYVLTWSPDEVLVVIGAHFYRPDALPVNLSFLLCVAISLAILRDGSSGGVVRLAAITSDGIERQTFLQEELPEWASLS